MSDEIIKFQEEGPPDPPVKRKRGRPLGSKGGRPKFEPNDDQRERVMIMTSKGVPHVDQAKVIGCDAKILRKYFRDELDNGKEKANACVAGALFKKAMDGNVSAQIFWLKARANWKEADRLEVTGKDGAGLMNPIERSQRLAHLLMKNPRVREILSKSKSS